MTQTLTTLTVIAVLAATPALAAKPILPTGGTSHGSAAPADNMADKLNGDSLSATQSGGSYTPTPASTGDTAGMKHHSHAMRMSHHRMHHMGMSHGGMRPDETATPGMSNNPAATGNPVK